MKIYVRVVILIGLISILCGVYRLFVPTSDFIFGLKATWPWFVGLFLILLGLSFWLGAFLVYKGYPQHFDQDQKK
jgi:hypothetical protein